VVQYTFWTRSEDSCDLDERYEHKVIKIGRVFTNLDARILLAPPKITQTGLLHAARSRCAGSCRGSAAAEGARKKKKDEDMAVVGCGFSKWYTTFQL
jgi:hypothetical protein